MPFTTSPKISATFYTFTATNNAQYENSTNNPFPRHSPKMPQPARAKSYTFTTDSPRRRRATVTNPTSPTART
jgi:hypothetical protein